MGKLDTLDPDFKAQIEQLLMAVESLTGLQWVCTDGRRTMAEQDKLFAQGRTKPGKVVTKAPPGSSAHNYGLAVDLWPLDKDRDIWWEAPAKTFKPLADLAVDMGLTAGYYFQSIFDAPHVEHPSWKIQQALWRDGKVTIA
jgi:peptidoglycan L-alanyl-D-glutamate endopeptidase CwlK